MYRQEFVIRSLLLVLTCLVVVFEVTPSVQARQYNTSAEAEAAATAAKSRMEQAKTEIEEIRQRKRDLEKQLADMSWRSPDVSDIDRRIAEIRAEIDAIRQTRNQAAQDYRDGLYCSQCDDSKTVIESTGKETFEQHLRRVDGERVRKSEQEITELIKPYNDKIAALEAQLRELENQRREILGRHGQAVNELQRQIDELRRALDRLDYEKRNAWSEYIFANGQVSVLKMREEFAARHQAQQALAEARRREREARDRLWRIQLAVWAARRRQAMEDHETTVPLKSLAIYVPPTVRLGETPAGTPMTQGADAPTSTGTESAGNASEPELTPDPSIEPSRINGLPDEENNDQVRQAMKEARQAEQEANHLRQEAARWDSDAATEADDSEAAEGNQGVSKSEIDELEQQMRDKLTSMLSPAVAPPSPPAQQSALDELSDDGPNDVFDEDASRMALAENANELILKGRKLFEKAAPEVRGYMAKKLEDATMSMAEPHFDLGFNPPTPDMHAQEFSKSILEDLMHIPPDDSPPEFEDLKIAREECDAIAKQIKIMEKTGRKNDPEQIRAKEALLEAQQSLAELEDNVKRVRKNQLPISPEERRSGVKQGLALQARLAAAKRELSALTGANPLNSQQITESLEETTAGGWMKQETVTALAGSVAEESWLKFRRLINHAILNQPVNPPDDQGAQLDDEVVQSASHANLVYRTAPFGGLNAIFGLKNYMEELLDAQMRQLGFAIESVNAEAQ